LPNGPTVVAVGKKTTVRRLLPLTMVMSAGALVVNMDTVIMNVALDTVSRAFHAPLSTMQWTITGYLLALAAIVPLTGWASHRFGARRLWIGSLCVFVGASALSGAAWSAHSLIVFRVIQGLGGGMVLPAGHGIIVRAADTRRMGRTMSAVNLPLLIGPLLGPVIGGVLVELVGWRSIFYVNIPVCLTVLVLARRLIPRDEPQPGRKLDVVGLVLLSPGLTLLVYSLTQFGRRGAAGNELRIGTLVAAALLIALFIAHSLTLAPGASLVDVKLFGRRAFLAPAIVAFMFSFMMSGALVLYPLYWQIVRGKSPIHAGLLMGPQGIGSFITILFIGRLSDRYGAARLAPIGLIALLAGTILWARVGAQTAVGVLVVATFVRGLGISFLGTPAYAAAYGSLERDAVPRATTAYNIVQRCGSALGVAAAIVLLQHQLPTTLGTDASRHPSQAVAHAFGNTFLLLVLATLITFIPAALLPWTPAERASA
jgi:EmrB/QacA subfamily drug resistance transporter